VDLSVAAAGGRALDEYGLLGVGEVEVVGYGQDLDRSSLGTAPVATFRLPVPHLTWWSGD
jgi:hypothetical protein